MCYGQNIRLNEQLKILAITFTIYFVVTSRNEWRLIWTILQPLTFRMTSHPTFITGSQGRHFRNIVFHVVFRSFERLSIVFSVNKVRAYFIADIVEWKLSKQKKIEHVKRLQTIWKGVFFVIFSESLKELFSNMFENERLYWVKIVQTKHFGKPFESSRRFGKELLLKHF